jgi:23S rRNA (cytosine1962-C5)-methyltransferase
MIQLLSPQNWKDYELIDCGNFEKLERFGNVILIRPEPQAVWGKRYPESEWTKQHHIRSLGSHHGAVIPKRAQTSLCSLRGFS